MTAFKKIKPRLSNRMHGEFESYKSFLDFRAVSVLMEPQAVMRGIDLCIRLLEKKVFAIIALETDWGTFQRDDDDRSVSTLTSHLLTGPSFE